MDRDDGEVEIGDGCDGADKVCIVDTLAVVAHVLSGWIPESVDGAALEPHHHDLGDIEDDVENGDGDETAADFGI